MSIYTGPVFEMARTQFGIIADHLDIPGNERARLPYPKRAITVSIPVHMDDGRTEVFQGYRVQYHLTLGPSKWGTRFSASLDIGKVAALAGAPVGQCLQPGAGARGGPWRAEPDGCDGDRGGEGAGRQEAARAVPLGRTCRAISPP